MQNTKKIALTLFGIFFGFSLNSQSINILADRNVSDYYADTLYSQIDYHYSNISDSTCVLWIEKEINGLQFDNSIGMFNYKGNNIIILVHWLKY